MAGTNPNKLLATIRELVRLHDECGVMSQDDLLTMISAIDGLDQWMMKGGFLPADWANARYRAGTKHTASDFGTGDKE
jgi:hypothetical protein